MSKKGGIAFQGQYELVGIKLCRRADFNQNQRSFRLETWKNIFSGLYTHRMNYHGHLPHISKTQILFFCVDPVTLYIQSTSIKGKHLNIQLTRLDALRPEKLFKSSCPDTEFVMAK